MKVGPAWLRSIGQTQFSGGLPCQLAELRPQDPHGAFSGRMRPPDSNADVFVPATVLEIRQEAALSSWPLVEDRLAGLARPGVTPRAPGHVSVSSSAPLPLLLFLGARREGGGDVCPQMPALFLEPALIPIPGHVGCDRRWEQTPLE